MSIVYFLLIIHDQKKIMKAQKSKTIGKIVKSLLKEKIYYKKHCHELDSRQEDMPMDIIVKIKPESKTSYPEYVLWGICKWLSTKSGKSFRN